MNPAYAPTRPSFAPTPGTAKRTHIEFPSGRVLETGAGPDESFTVRGPTGMVELRVRFEDGGPVLHFRAADLSIDTPGTVGIDCKRFEIRAAEDIVQSCQGSLRQEVKGDLEADVHGDISVEGRTVAVEAHRGDVALKANDDVSLQGERINLNC